MALGLSHYPASGKEVWASYPAIPDRAVKSQLRGILMATENGGCFFYRRGYNIAGKVVPVSSSTIHLLRGITVTLRTILQLVLTIGVCGTAGHVSAYDTSPYSPGSLDPCTQVYFSAFKPAPFSAEKNNVAVAPKSEFSFLASKATNWPSITVKIKDEKVPVTVTAITNGHLVKGKLPDSVKGRYIRLEIFAKGPNNCDKADGWLLKVGN